MAIPRKTLEHERQRIPGIARHLFTELDFFFVRHATSQANNLALRRLTPVQHDDLIEQAKKLGAPISSGTYKPKTEAWDELAVTDYELPRRIREEQRHRREHRLWIVAVISAVFAILSAVRRG